MRRTALMALAMAITTAALPGCVPDGLGAGTPSAVPEGMVPDPTYKPSVGDRAVLYGTNGQSPMDAIPLLKDMTAFDLYERSAQSSDSAALGDMVQQGELTWTPLGTRVILLATHDRSHTGSRLAAEVKALDGPKKDQQAWVPLEYLARLRPAPTEE